VRPSALLVLVRSLDIRDRNRSCPKSRRIFDGLCPPEFYGGCPLPKFVKSYHACLATRHVEKFREVTPTGPKVIMANTLNFKPIVKCSFLQIVGAPVPGHSLARVKN